MGRSIVYLTNNGLGEPHVASQVLPYLELAQRPVHLVTCEKPDADVPARAEALERLQRFGGTWRGVRYRRPPLGTWTNARAMARAAVRAARRAGPSIFHARSYVAAVAARLAARRTGDPWIFDMRGFYLEERIDDGRMKRGSFLHRRLQRMEKDLLASADAVVVLTQRAKDLLRQGRFGPPPAVVEVVPCAVDLRLYPPRPEGATHPLRLAYVGTLGPGYLVEEMGAFAARLAKRGWHLAVASRQDGGQLVQAAIRHGAPAAATQAVDLRPSQVPPFLRQADAGILLWRDSLARAASSAIKLGEYLAAGLPVVLSPGCGDASAWVEQERVGVVVHPGDPASFSKGAERLEALLADPGIRARCRAVAETRLSLQEGAQGYASLYCRLEEASRS